MAYQRCPVCEGDGFNAYPSSDTIDELRKLCHVCNGEGIVDDITGQPPSKNKTIVKMTNEGDYIRVPRDEIIKKTNG